MTTAAIPVTLPGNRPRPLDIADIDEELKVPPPRYRHAAPSAPWPWMDFKQDVADVSELLRDPNEPPWGYYPQSCFGNWTPDQVERCRMLSICKGEYECQIHTVDVFADGKFDKPDEVRTRRIPSEPQVAMAYWNELQEPFDRRFRVRVLFIENITLNVLRILGEKYDIEPFFFASSANWIPSRYQENPHHGKGDHITVVLPFIRVVKNPQERGSSTLSNYTSYSAEKGGLAPITDKKHTIDTQAPLVLSGQHVLLQDLLAIHMVRNVEQNIIISYHHHSALQKTTARRLQSLVQRTGDSVYWQKLYEKSKDPTFVFLAMLWYALYAWDEALEVLYAHLSEQLEATDATTNINHTRELHKLQAHLLYYQQLLRDFRKSVEFVRKTQNPAMSNDSVSEGERESSKKLLESESDHLISEIERLDKQRQIQLARLENATKLAFSTVNIEDSRSMQKLTQATMLDSAAMKQISYLTMIFLPASFLSSVFGMNVNEINPGTLETLASYVESTIILTLITAWVVIALQDHSSFHLGKDDNFFRRVAWPVFYVYAWMKKLATTARKSLLDRRRR